VKNNFRFPKSEELRNSWLCFVNRPDFQPSQWSTVCSIHFELDCFIPDKKIRFLKSSAVPTIYPASKRTLPVEQCVAHDHPYLLPPAKELKRRNNMLVEEMSSLKKKIKLLQDNKRKLIEKCTALSDVIKAIKEKNIVSPSVSEILEQESLKVPAQLFQRILDSQGKKRCAEKLYTKELRAFAITLNFYSSRAYNYVRETFDLCLPCERTIRRWYAAVDAEPGFTAEAFSTLEKKVEEEKLLQREVLVSLTFDEVSIRKKVEWNGERFVGAVDLGTGTEPDDSALPATEALVLMVVSLNSSWKLPIAYFMIAHLSADEKVSILTSALKKLHDIKVEVVSVTCDAPPTNISTLKKLGASFDLSAMNCSFPHPSDHTKLVAVIMDPCHMIKLARNCLADLKVLKDPEGNEIRWDFIEKLHEVQEEAGLRAGNKLRSAHIRFRKMKMKVSLAAQTLRFIETSRN
jgi:hypothetical protein